MLLIERFSAINGDLVNSHHLLLCCVNFIYINVLSCNRNDLFNRQLNVKLSDLKLKTSLFDDKERNNDDEEDEEEEEEDDNAGDSEDIDEDEEMKIKQLLHLIIDDLCQHHDGLVIETKTINEHYFKPHIKHLISKKILFCSSKTFLGLLNQTKLGGRSNFELNW